MKIKPSGNGEITRSFTDVGKSCPSHLFLTWQICLLTLFHENKILAKVSEFTVSIIQYHQFQYPHSIFRFRGNTSQATPIDFLISTLTKKHPLHRNSNVNRLHCIGPYPCGTFCVSSLEQTLPLAVLLSQRTQSFFQRPLY